MNSTNDRKKRMLILGAGNAQIDLIKYCGKRNIETFGCSYNNTDPGISFLDHFTKIDIVDIDAVYAYARESQVDFIYSIGSDIAIPTICEVSRRLELPCFVDVSTAKLCCNKFQLRQTLEETEYHIPFLGCYSYEETEGWKEYPVQIKPVDSQGQRGVGKADNEKQVKACFEFAKQYSRSGQVILEKSIEGNEISVHAFLRNGTPLFVLLSDRETFAEFPGGIVKGHHVPSNYEATEVREKVLKMIQDVTKRLHILEGPVYFQIMINDGIPHLIEVSPRLDGCHMWRLIYLYCGVDLLDLTIQSLMGKEPEIPPMKISGALKTKFFCEAPGRVFREDKFCPEKSLFHQYYYRDGETVHRINGFMEKCGYQICYEGVENCV